MTCVRQELLSQRLRRRVLVETPEPRLREQIFSVGVLLPRVIHSSVLMKVNEEDPSSPCGRLWPQPLLSSARLLPQCEAADLGGRTMSNLAGFSNSLLPFNRWAIEASRSRKEKARRLTFQLNQRRSQ